MSVYLDTWSRNRGFPPCFALKTVPPRSQGEDQFPQISDDQPRNPFTEVMVLTGHISTVHQIIKIDDRRSDNT